MRKTSIAGFISLSLLISIGAGCSKGQNGLSGDSSRSPALDAPITMPAAPAMQPTTATEKPAPKAPAPTPKPAVASPTPAPVPKTFRVAIRSFNYSPGNVLVQKGTTVTWVNYDQSSHTVTGDNGGPKSGTLAPGKSYSYTFNEIGNFDYHCAIHPSMKGTIVVTP